MIDFKILSKIKDDSSKVFPKFLFILGIVGIALIFLSSIVPKKQDKPLDTNSYNSTDEMQYIEQTEKKLQDILLKTYGVGNVKVMLTLESDGDYIYAKNERSDSEKDNSNSELAKEKRSYEKEHIIVENTTGNEALIETHISPTVKGVAVICEGGGDILVIKRVTDIICALMDVSTNNICVTKMI